jgi:protein-disulfide isomerase
MRLPALTLLFSIASAALAQAPDDATVDAIIRKLESSGALDRAVERGIERYIQRQQEAQQNAQAQQTAQLRERAKNVRKVDPGRDHVRGNPKATISLIEYSDYECPFCKRFHPTLQALAARYGDKVNWVWRHYPLPFHQPAAGREAIAAECAAKVGGHAGFWKFSDELIHATRGDGKGLPENMSVPDLAAKAGLNAAKFADCLKSPLGSEAIKADMDDAAQGGITATPTTVIRNNATGAVDIVVGAQPLEAVAQQIDRLLGK